MGDAIKVYNNGECAFGKVSEGQGHTRRIMLIEGVLDLIVSRRTDLNNSGSITVEWQAQWCTKVLQQKSSYKNRLKLKQDTFEPFTNKS